jgi:hypothetical protein
MSGSAVFMLSKKQKQKTGFMTSTERLGGLVLGPGN